MDSIFMKKIVDRINRIFRIFFDLFPEEKGQTPIAFGEIQSSPEITIRYL